VTEDSLEEVIVFSVERHGATFFFVIITPARRDVTGAQVLRRNGSRSRTNDTTGNDDRRSFHEK